MLPKRDLSLTLHYKNLEGFHAYGWWAFFFFYQYIVDRRTHHLKTHIVQIILKWHMSEISKLIISEALRPVVDSHGRGILIYPVSMLQRNIYVQIFVDMCESFQ